MATNAENLETAIASILTELAANALKGDYSMDGQSETRRLEERLEKLMAMRTMVAGPFEELTQGET